MSAINPTTNSCCTPAAKHYTAVACTGVLVVGMIALSIISLSAPQLLGKFAFPPGKAIIVLATSGTLLTLFTIFTIAIKCRSPHQPQKQDQASQATVSTQHSPPGSDASVPASTQSTTATNSDAGQSGQSPQATDVRTESVQGPTESTDATKSDAGTFKLNTLNLPTDIVALDAKGKQLTAQEISARVATFFGGHPAEGWTFEVESEISRDLLQTCLNLLVSTNDELLSTPLSMIVNLCESSDFTLPYEILYYRIYLMEKYTPELLPQPTNLPPSDWSNLTLRDFWQIQGVTIPKRNSSGWNVRHLFISYSQLEQILSSSTPLDNDWDFYDPQTPIARQLMQRRGAQVKAEWIKKNILVFPSAFLRCIPLSLLNEIPWQKFVNITTHIFWQRVFDLSREGQDGEQEFSDSTITAREYTQKMLNALTPENYAIIFSKLTPEQQALRENSHGANSTKQSTQPPQVPSVTQPSAYQFPVLNLLNLPNDPAAFDAQGKQLTPEEISARITTFFGGHPAERWAIQFESEIPPDLLQKYLNLLFSTNEELLATPLQTIFDTLDQSHDPSSPRNSLCALDSILYYRIYLIEKYQSHLLPEPNSSPPADWSTSTLRDFWGFKGDKLPTSPLDWQIDLRRFISYRQLDQILASQTKDNLYNRSNHCETIFASAFQMPITRQLMKQRLATIDDTKRSGIAACPGHCLRSLPLSELNKLPWDVFVATKNYAGFWGDLFYLPNPGQVDDQEFFDSPATGSQHTAMMLNALTPENYAIIVSKLTPEQQALRNK